MSASEFLLKYYHGDYNNADVDDTPGLDEVLAFIGSVRHTRVCETIRAHPDYL